MAAAIDVCLSTQTNDVIGNVRTTGKLPLYLAAGRFVLASRVGEAARVLPPRCWSIPRRLDPDYPAKLAERVEPARRRRAPTSAAPAGVRRAGPWALRLRPAGGAGRGRDRDSLASRGRPR